MEIIEQNRNDIPLFSIRGRLDSNTSTEFEERLFGVIEKGAKDLIVDFGELEYISSAGLRVILKTAKKLGRAGGNIILCSMRDYVKEVFEISGFDSFLTIVPGPDDALEKLTP